MVEDVYARRAARVLLVDGAERLLLFRATLDPALVADGHDVCWFTPGGGVEAGETLAGAAARELREETRLVVAPADLGDPVAYSEGSATFDWASGRLRDDFFFLRVDAHDVDVSGFQAEEAAVILGHGWWPVPELSTTDALVFPLGLVALLEDLLADRRPAVPVELPWHHDDL
jgi:8-oxo-dGTP pyrophosphatase MutT (NUDIX family)